jgi:membrane-bound lytic murein transglycosylase MltF
MRVISESEIHIFREEERLDRFAREAKLKWLDEVQKSHIGEMEYEDTRPFFDEYMKAHRAWKEYFKKMKIFYLCRVLIST